MYFRAAEGLSVDTDTLRPGLLQGPARLYPSWVRHIIVLASILCRRWQARVTPVNLARDTIACLFVEHSGTASWDKLIVQADLYHNERTAIPLANHNEDGWKVGLHGPLLASPSPSPPLHLGAMGVAGSEPAPHCFLLVARPLLLLLFAAPGDADAVQAPLVDVFGEGLAGPGVGSAHGAKCGGAQGRPLLSSSMLRLLSPSPESRVPS